MFKLPFSTLSHKRADRHTHADPPAPQRWHGVEPLEQRVLLAADLAMAGVNPTPHDHAPQVSFDVVPGSTRVYKDSKVVKVRMSVTNMGKDTARDINVGVRLSRDDNITNRQSDRRVGHVEIDRLRPGETTDTMELFLRLPANDRPIWDGNGEYFIGAFVDDGEQIHESNEKNNAGMGMGIDMDTIRIRLVNPANRSDGEPDNANQKKVYNRAIDGSGNNRKHESWGMAGTAMLREDSGAHYPDGSAMPGSNRPSPREISNAVVAQDKSILNDRMLSDFVWQWGQFIDHDMDLTPTTEEYVGISVPRGDPYFDPTSTGTQIIAFERSVYMDDTGSSRKNPRQQPNVITAFIDASNVYGSDADRAWALRTAGGKLKTSEGDLLPYNVKGMDNAGGTGSELFLAGDVRANEQVALTAMHTLFVREHNRLADELAKEHPNWSGERIYQKARKIVGGIIQWITYNEFLPALLGNDAPSAHSRDYDSDIDPSISNAFATAAYRIGHTMLSDTLLRLDNKGRTIAEGNLSLGEAFFNVNAIVNEGGIEPLLKGLASQRMQEIDTQLVNGVRNLLFGPPGAGGLDLASLNIQRGRDHGLADYNTMREDFGLEPVRRFSDITSDRDLASELRELYGDVDNIDAWIGGLAEDHLSGSSVGELFTAVLVDQFTRIRDGDRYWYEHDDGLTRDEKEMIEHTRLSDVIKRNTDLTNIQNNVFFV